MTDDANGTITFHLVTPDPDFLYKLALPFAYPFRPSTPEEHQREEGVPGTGPYMLEGPMTGEGFALKRNPHFREWSPSAQPDGYVDRIEWAFGVGAGGAGRGGRRRGDRGPRVRVLSRDNLDELLIRFAAQLHVDPVPWSYFVVLNTRSPPFDDLDVRKAVNLALDRDRVVEIFGGAAVPTCQQLPPNFPGYEPYCPYTLDPGRDGKGSWTAPDLEQAKRLVRGSGTKGMRVAFDYIEDWHDRPPSREASD